MYDSSSQARDSSRCPHGQSVDDACAECWAAMPEPADAVRVTL